MKRIWILLLSSFFLIGCATSGAVPNNALPVTNQSSSSGAQVEYYFTQAHQHPDEVLESLIGSAKSKLDIAIYSLTKKEIVDAILAAKQRGVSVRIITDKTEAKSKSQEGKLLLFRNAGIPVKENTHAGLMHLKVSIIDTSVVTTGSFNYTQNASTENDEVLVVIHDPGAAAQFESQFERMWNDKGNFAEIK